MFSSVIEKDTNIQILLIEERRKKTEGKKIT